MSEEQKYYSCKVCGFSPNNRRTWCDKGCGSDYNEMRDVTDVVIATRAETLKEVFDDISGAEVDREYQRMWVAIDIDKLKALGEWPITINRKSLLKGEMPDESDD